MKNILITGASGFIGRHCLPLLLSKGFEIHAIDLKILTENRASVNWHELDLLNCEKLSELMAKVHPTHLLHFAWTTEHGRFWSSLENLWWVQGSLNLIQAFWKSGGKRLVMAGTCAEYDWHYGYCSEKVTPLIPTSMYGICKHSLQTMLSAFARQTGLSAAWGRIFFLYGPYENPKRLISSVIRSLLKNEPTYCTDGQQVRDFLYVKDVAAAFVALLESDVAGPINIASGNPLKVEDIILNIATKINRPDLVRLGALARPADDPPFLVGDTTRLNKELRWSPNYDLDTGIYQTISWWKDTLNRVGNE